MDTTLNSISVQGLSSVSEALGDASMVVVDISAQPILGGENVIVDSAPPNIDAILAQMRMETNEARLNAARCRLSSALSRLSGLSAGEMEKVEKMKVAGEELAVAMEDRQAAKVEFEAAAAELELKKTALDEAEKANAGDAQYNQGMRDSARACYGAAKKEYDAAMEKYEKAQSYVGDRQDTFDALVKSLDTDSLAALRDILRLSANDVDHLQNEIESDAEKREFVPGRSVEDVIGDALKRLDGEMIDEIEDRHLEHV